MLLLFTAAKGATLGSCATEAGSSGSLLLVGWLGATTASAVFLLAQEPPPLPIRNAAMHFNIGSGVLNCTCAATLNVLFY
jgi:hypothetical protein